MEIKINNQKIDFSLEDEKTLGDIVDGIYQWLGSSGYRISAIEHDGSTIYPDADPQENWKRHSIDGVKLLHFTVLSQSEQHVQDLHTIHQYISLFNHALSAGNQKLLSELLEDLPYITQHIDLFLGGRDNYGASLQQLIDSSGVKEGEFKSPVKNLMVYCQNLLVLLSSRISEFTNPFLEMKSSATALQQLLPKLSDVSVLLQTGKDKEAMNLIIEFTEISQKLIRLYSIIRDEGYTDLADKPIEGQSFSEFYEEMNGILRELEEAFNSGDSVLIGDLLEYEIAPKLEKLLEFISKIETIEKE